MIITSAFTLASFHSSNIKPSENLRSLSALDPEGVSFNSVSVKDASSVDHAVLAGIVFNKVQRTSTNVSGGVSTVALSMLNARVTVLSVASTKDFDVERNVSVFGEPVDGGVSRYSVAKVHTETLWRVNTLEEAVVTWENALSTERARIKAEEERKAREAEEARIAAAKAEAARIAAINAAKPNRVTIPAVATPSSGSASSPAPAASESQQARLERIASTLPFSVPTIVIGDCSATGLAAAVACYSVGGTVITVIPSYLNRPDCKLRRVIAHEARHYWQYSTGKLTFDANGQVSNAAWAESDAYAFGDSYGCK